MYENLVYLQVCLTKKVVNMAFAANVRKKQSLTRDNYIQTHFCSFRSDPTQEYIDDHVTGAMKNFDLNMKRFHKVTNEDFNRTLNLVIETENFTEASNLAKLKGKSGYYIIVLDEYNQAYIGKSIHIEQRIRQHWNRKMPLDRLVFGNEYSSILSIDSFRNQDTTRLFYKVSANLSGSFEEDVINKFPVNYLLNRTAGGMTSLNDSWLNMHTSESKHQPLKSTNNLKSNETKRINPNKHPFLNYLAWLFSKN